MSRAFIKEDVPEEVPLTSLVAPLPEGAVNYVTPRGKQLLQEAVRHAEKAVMNEPDPTRLSGLRQSLEELRYRTLSAKVIDLSSDPPPHVRFGATVTLKGENRNASTVTLVGVDEADPAAGRISFYGALAQALVGKRAGDLVVLEEEEREVRWQVVSISYGAACDE